MNFNIVDPGLRELSGHHYDFVRKIHNYLTSQGHSVKVYAHINVSEDIVSKFDNITPLFRSFPYPQFHGEILDYHNHSQMISEDLQKVSHADYWIWPSTFSFQVNGFRMSNRMVKSVGCIHVEYDYHHAVYGKEQWIHGLTDNFKLFAMEQKLVKHYNEIGVDCKYVPNPADNYPLENPKTDLKIIGFFGHQRNDKGTNSIIGIIDALVSKYQIILHDSAGQVRYDNTNVQCYSAVPDISVLMRQCDLVILPYDRTKYQKMSSGILCEALSIGIPCIVPSKTTLSDWIEQTSAGLVFEEDIIKAVELANTNYQIVANHAHENAKVWRTKYGIEKFISVLLEKQ